MLLLFRDRNLILYDMSVIRSAGLRGFRATVAELGGDAERIAASVGLPAAALDTDDMLVPDQAVAAVLELAAQQLDCPDLGLRVSARQDLDMLGPLALAIRNSPTLAEVMECTARYLFVHAPALTIGLGPDPYGDDNVIAMRYGFRSGGRPVPLQGTDLGLGFVHRAIQRLVDERYGLRSVELPYLPTAATAVYERFFGAPVRVGRPAALLRVPRELVTRSVAGGDEKLHRLALAFLAAQTASDGTAATPRVRTTVRQLLGTVAPDIAAVAELLTIHPRTLQRRLAAEHTSFAAILDEIRRERAQYYLTATSMPMTQITALLGLAEQATLTRCCRRWWGATPTAIRRSGTEAENRSPSGRRSEPAK